MMQREQPLAPASAPPVAIRPRARTADVVGKYTIPQGRVFTWCPSCGQPQDNCCCDKP